LLEPESLDAYINAIVPIIMMLDYSEINIEISNASIETIESDNYRGILRDNKF